MTTITDDDRSNTRSRIEAIGAAGKRWTREQARADQISGIPAGRYGTPEEFGATCAFLCSAHAGFISGMNMHLDGGAYPALV